MSKYSQLSKQCKSKGIKVREVKSNTLKDYGGMNPRAAKSLGFNRKMKPKTIWIDKNMDSEKKYRTLKHELVEMHLMGKGKDYWDSHIIALKKERR